MDFIILSLCRLGDAECQRLVWYIITPLRCSLFLARLIGAINLSLDDLIGGCAFGNLLSTDGFLLYFFFVSDSIKTPLV